MANCCGDDLCVDERPPGRALAAGPVAGDQRRHVRGPAVMAGLALQGGWQVIRHARADLKTAHATKTPPRFKVESRHKPVG